MPAFLYPRDFSANSSIVEDLANGHSNSLGPLLESTTSFLVRARHFAPKLDLMMFLVHLTPSMAM